MIGDAIKLKKHCNVYHYENKGFLKYGESPQEPIYCNFNSYLKGSAETLVFDPWVKKNKRGRPPKDPQKIDNIIKEIDHKLTIENDEKNQKERELNTNV